jgi:hypothetical protein
MQTSHGKRRSRRQLIVATHWTYDARWRVPRTAHGGLRFCVQSMDAAGNKSNLSCSRSASGKRGRAQ